MKIKRRTDILNDIIREAKKHPKGWTAAFGRDNTLCSHDCYIFNPHTGIYLLKEFQKNPFQTKGVGSKIARHIDEDIQEQIQGNTGEFGIIQGNIQKIMTNINKGIDPQQILEEGLKGKDLGIRLPVKGQAATSKDAYRSLKNSFSSEQKKVNKRFEQLATDDGLYQSYD